MFMSAFVTITFLWTKINTAEGCKTIITEFFKRLFATGVLLLRILGGVLAERCVSLQNDRDMKEQADT